MGFSKLNFGTAGIPFSTEKPTTERGLLRVKELGLGGMELEFVHSVNLKEDTAKLVKKAKEENDLLLSCHGSYYINLNAVEEDKRSASINRVLSAARMADKAGAFTMTFHSAFYLTDSPEVTFNNVKKRLEEITSTLKKEKVKITIRPETTGKPKQFGSIDELLLMSQQVDNVLPCIDFSHLHARTNGKYNTYEEFRGVLENSEKMLGKDFLHNMHIHVAGIAYSEKGEQNHLMLKESDFNYKDLLKVLKEFDCRGLLVCESPNPEVDALLLKKTFEEL